MGASTWGAGNGDAIIRGTKLFVVSTLSFSGRKRQTGRSGTWGARRTGEDCIKEDNLVSTIVRTIE